MRCDLRVICERWHGTGERKLDMAARGYSYRQRTTWGNYLHHTFLFAQQHCHPVAQRIAINVCEIYATTYVRYI